MQLIDWLRESEKYSSLKVSLSIDGLRAIFDWLVDKLESALTESLMIDETDSEKLKK